MPPTLHLRVETGRGTALYENEHELTIEPFWTVSISGEGLTIDSFVAGAHFVVANGYDESRHSHVANFYYGFHDASSQNCIEILEVDEDRFLIRMEGQMTDDNSKPPARIGVRAWFVEGT